MTTENQHNNQHDDDKTSDLLERVVKDYQQDRVTLGEIKQSLHERGFGVLMAIAALPLCIPVPVPPGYTTFFAIPLFILAVQMIAGRDTPWLPKWLERKSVKRQTLATMVEKATPLLRKIEKLLKPRINRFGMEWWEKTIGIFSFIFAVSIAVPLPLTNLPPGYGILIMSLGLLGKDGVTIIIGIIIGIIGIIITAGVIIGGAEIISEWFGSAPAPVILPDPPPETLQSPAPPESVQ